MGLKGLAMPIPLRVVLGIRGILVRITTAIKELVPERRVVLGKRPIASPLVTKHLAKPNPLVFGRQRAIARLTVRGHKELVKAWAAAGNALGIFQIAAHLMEATKGLAKQIPVAFGMTEAQLAAANITLRVRGLIISVQAAMTPEVV
jgi:hypothetical protein